MNINRYALRKERSLQKIISKQPKPNTTAIGVCSETQVTHHIITKRSDECLPISAYVPKHKEGDGKKFPVIIDIYGGDFVAVQRLTQLKMLEFQSKPHCWESECRSLFVATAKAKNIRLVFEANGKEMQVQYPVSNLITFEMIKKKVISTWAIAPRKLSNEVKEFLAENCADYSKYWSDIPMKAVSRIESGRKVLWKNPIFEETKK